MLLLVLASPAAAHKRHHHHHHKPKDVKVQLLALNDFHGQLCRPRRPAGIRPPTPAGEPAAAPIAGGRRGDPRQLPAGSSRKGHRNSLTVAAGDLIGASPLLSALFHDEPTIEAMNLIGLDLTSVGNHEFDEGERRAPADAERRLPPDRRLPGRHRRSRAPTSSTCPPTCSTTRTGKPFFTPYAIRQVPGQEGRLHRHDARGDADIVSPSGIADLKFRDEADTANHYARELKRQRRQGDRRAAARGRLPVRPVQHRHASTTCTGFSGRRHGHRRRARPTGRRRVRHRPHAPAVQLRDRRPAGHERELVRAPGDRPRAEARRGAAASKAVSADNVPIVAAGRSRRTDVAGARRPLRRAVGAAAPARRSARSRADITRDPDADGSGENAGRQPDRRRAARRHRRRRPRRRGGRADEPGRRARRPHLRPERHEGTGSSPTRRRSRSSRSTTSSPPRRSRARSCWTC